MAPFTQATPRALVTLAVEGGLIFAVLSLLTLATVQISESPTEVTFTQVAVMSLVFSLCIHLSRHSTITGEPNIRQEILILTLISVAVGGVASLFFWLVVDGSNPTLAVLSLQGALVVPAFIATWRWAALRWQVLTYYRERILIVGTGETAKQVCRWIAESHAHEYSVVGFADEDQTREGEVLAMGARIVTDYRSLSRFCPRRVDRVIVALDEKRGKLPVKQLINARVLGLQIEDATSFFEKSSGKISVEMLLPSWLIYSDGFHTSKTRSFLKRIVDLLHATTLLVLTLPVMLVTALAILIESGTPVLYRQRRMGLEGREFDVLKFRSMVKDAEKGGPVWAKKNDPRVTRVGKVIRKLRIDELPQLFNVLRGEMSFVGPRPERAHFVKRLQDKIPYYMLRMTVRPGITGWAQVQFHYGSSDEDALEKLKYDLFYIKNNNVVLDLWIILKTVKVVLLGSGR